MPYKRGTDNRGSTVLSLIKIFDYFCKNFAKSCFDDHEILKCKVANGMESS